MRLKKKLLEKSYLYVIVDKKIGRNQPLSSIVKRMKLLGLKPEVSEAEYLSGHNLSVPLRARFLGRESIKYCGADIIQYRDKESKKEDILKNAFLLQKSLLNTKCVFIINDYLDVAKIVNSDGIHLGQDDVSIEIARKVLGRDKIIGISCHNLKQAFAAQKRGADYIAIGPVFATSLKPEYKPIGLNLIKELKAKIKIPFFAVGGINQSNINEVRAFGAERVAVCRAILCPHN
jgi:thiamine-phosphate pyrophosphorylase